MQPWRPVSDRCASGTEGNACGLVWAKKMLETADDHAAGLTALSLAPVASTCIQSQLECWHALWSRRRGGAGMVKAGHLGG